MIVTPSPPLCPHCPLQVGKPKRTDAVVTVPEELESRLMELVGDSLTAAYK